MSAQESSIEGDLPTEKKVEAERITVAKLLFGFSGLYERWRNEQEIRRHQDPRDQDPRDQDPDYGRRLRELEGQIAEIDREQQGFRMGDYHEGGGDKWHKWAMPGLVTLAVSGIIANVVQAMTVSALKQEVEDLRQEVNDVKKLVEPRFRGG